MVWITGQARFGSFRQYIVGLESRVFNFWTQTSYSVSFLPVGGGQSHDSVTFSTISETTCKFVTGPGGAIYRYCIKNCVLAMVLLECHNISTFPSAVNLVNCLITKLTFTASVQTKLELYGIATEH